MSKIHNDNKKGLNNMIYTSDNGVKYVTNTEPDLLDINDVKKIVDGNFTISKNIFKTFKQEIPEDGKFILMYSSRHFLIGYVDINKERIPEEQVLFYSDKYDDFMNINLNDKWCYEEDLIKQVEEK